VQLRILLWLTWFLFITTCAHAQKPLKLKYTESGLFAVGIRSGITIANSTDGWNLGQGMGLQFRIMPSSHINTEWYFELFHGGYSDRGVRTDGHIGGLVLLYPQKKLQRVAPFLAVGPNADFVKIRERENKENFTSRWSLGAQAGIGFHVNLTWRSDMTIGTQYMLHFGKAISIPLEDTGILALPRDGSGMDGHFLFNVSFNYKIADLWKRIRF